MSDYSTRGGESIRMTGVRSSRAAHLELEQHKHHLIDQSRSTTAQGDKEGRHRPALARIVALLCLALACPLMSFIASGATTTNYSYDDQGRLATSNFDNGKSVIYKLDAAGNRTQVQLSTDTTPPSVPTGLAGTAVSGSQINLTWNASTDNVGVTGYIVYRNGVSVGMPTTTNFSDTGLSSYVTYNYTVAARDAANNVSAQSSPAVPVRTLDTIPPSAPGVPTISNITTTTATATWTAATDNAGVTSYDYNLNGGAWTGIGNVLTKALTGLTVGTSYTFAVRAHDAAGNIGPSSSKAFTTSAYVDTPTINVVSATVVTPNGNVTYVGYSIHGGSMTPTTTGNGRTYVSFYDLYGIQGTYVNTRFQVGGFTSDPGQGWLVSAAVTGLGTLSGASAAYSYSGGTATWAWTAPHFFSLTGSRSCTITHY